MDKIETKKDEIRYSTDDPKRMLNKFLVNRLLRRWTEGYQDKDGNIVPIERTEQIFDAGTYLTADKIQRIVFHQQAGDIKEPIEVSNQNRRATLIATMSNRIWMMKVCIAGYNRTFIVKARSAAHAEAAVADYIELNYEGSFAFTQVKMYDAVYYLEDNLKQEGDSEPEYKYYRISAVVEIDNVQEEDLYEFLVKAPSAERALMIINYQLTENEKTRAEKHNESAKDVKAYAEECKIVNITKTVPEEFSKAHEED